MYILHLYRVIYTCI